MLTIYVTHIPHQDLDFMSWGCCLQLHGCMDTRNQHTCGSNLVAQHVPPVSASSLTCQLYDMWIHLLAWIWMHSLPTVFPGPCVTLNCVTLCNVLIYPWYMVFIVSQILICRCPIFASIICVAVSGADIVALLIWIALISFNRFTSDFSLYLIAYFLSRDWIVQAVVQ